MESPAIQPRTSLPAAVGWGFFLACSWTWVIGMYLPVLLVRDYGWGGWLVFAIPNVIGAAALAWVVATPMQASTLLARHHAAVGLFSCVTISFQVFVLMWLLPTLVGPAGLVLVLAALGCALLAGPARALGTRVAAVVIWGISAAIFLMLWLGESLHAPPARGLEPTWHLIGLAPACLLGFALCPYLDVTFLHARSRTDSVGGRIAFALGFGVLFLVMILFSLFYAVPLITGEIARLAPPAWLLAIHLTLQVCFTVAVHARLTRSPIGVEAIVTPAGLLVSVTVAAVLGLAALQGEVAELEMMALGVGEIIYRGYMGFYGLLFPAYVLIVILGRGSRRLMIVTCLAALPFFAVGFLLRQMPWTAPGVVAVVVGGIVAWRGRNLA